MLQIIITMKLPTIALVLATLTYDRKEVLVSHPVGCTDGYISVLYSNETVHTSTSPEIWTRMDPKIVNRSFVFVHRLADQEKKFYRHLMIKTRFYYQNNTWHDSKWTSIPWNINATCPDITTADTACTITILIFELIIVLCTCSAIIYYVLYKMEK